MVAYRMRLGLFVIGLCAVQAWSEPETALFPIVQDGKWGYMDRSGKVAIPPRFDGAWEFSEGLAAVQIGMLRGYMDAQGALAIEPRFARARPFRNGLAAVLVDAKPWGAVMDGGRWVYIDKTGQIKLDPKNRALKSADEFQDGEARVSFVFNVHERFSHMDAKGSIRPFAGQMPGPFSEGLATKASKKDQYEYMGHDGKSAIPGPFREAGPFVEGLAPVRQDKTWFFIDKTGAKAFEGEFQDARSFAEGLAGVKIEGKWGCIDRAGKIVVAPQYDFVAPFSEGMARIVLAGKHGYMDKTGTVAVPPRFDAGWEFSQGLARIVADGKEGYIDRTGRMVWAPSQ